MFFILSVILVLICTLLLIIGIIKPQMVILWGKDINKTRKKVLLYYGSLLVLSLLACHVLGYTIQDTVGNSGNKLNSDKKHDLILLKLDEKGFKEECHDVSYENLLNKFAYYSQSKTTCTVKVTDFDVNEKGCLFMSVQMVNTPAKYTGNMYLTYTGTDTKLNKIKRGDILTVWGRADGVGLSYSKKTTAVKLPKMNVGYITIN